MVLSLAVSIDDGSIAAKAISVAQQQMGKPYVWGAGGPDAFDCSGLVYFAYATAGLPGTGKPTTHAWTTASIRFMGTGIANGSEQPGDLIMPDTGHVGICLGNGQYINAPHTGVNVRIDKYSNPVAIRRVATPSNGVVTGGVVNVGLSDLNPIQPFIDMFKAFDKTFQTLTDTHLWFRVLEVFGGTIMLYLATKVD